MLLLIILGVASLIFCYGMYRFNDTIISAAGIGFTVITMALTIALFISNTSEKDIYFDTVAEYNMLCEHPDYLPHDLWTEKAISYNTKILKHKTYYNSLLIGCFYSEQMANLPLINLGG